MKPWEILKAMEEEGEIWKDEEGVFQFRVTAKGFEHRWKEREGKWCGWIISPNSFLLGLHDGTVVRATKTIPELEQTVIEAAKVLIEKIEGFAPWTNNVKQLRNALNALEQAKTKEKGENS